LATIVGGIATSHTPSIAFAVDTKKADDPIWAPIFEGFAPVRQWLADKKPDVLFYAYNDHVTSFFFDHYSTFALGFADRFPVADEGGGPRPLPAIKGHPALAKHIANGLVADEFDLSFFQAKGLDHGVFSPLSMLLPHERAWPVALVPLQVGVLQFPIPTARRCFALGRSLRKAIQSFPEDLKVVVVGSGGLSHQVSGERAGFNNTDWDMEFLDLLEKDPEKLTKLSIADYAKRGGIEGAEVIMWLIMRGALTPKVRKIHQSYCLPSMTATATFMKTSPRTNKARRPPRISRAPSASTEASQSSKALIRSLSIAAAEPIGSTVIFTGSSSRSFAAGFSTTAKARTIEAASRKRKRICCARSTGVRWFNTA
jgi:gallate dioxygenase